MSLFSKKWRKLKRWIKRNKRLNRAIRKVLDIMTEDAADGVHEELSLFDVADLIRRLIKIRDLP